ncbi:MAG: MlaD family protein [Chthoniobacterales bacterium]|nr:MlaD family protein [Chthoniobacterales bacterium]
MNAPNLHHPDHQRDYGRVVTHSNVRLSWVWLFPLLALLVTGWFFWDKLRTEGPIIEIEFHEAPGIQANKTLLFYRGVAAGKVMDVRLDEHLSKALVKIRLKAFAAALSQAGTLYWIDQPVISLAKTSGLSSLIQGNSIQARLGEGPHINHFIGMEKAPLHPLEPPGLLLKLNAKEIPFLEEGSSITYRGITIGGIMRKGIEPDGNCFLIAGIQKQFASLIHKNSRFWNVSAAALTLGPNGIKLEMPNLKNMFLGSVAVDTFEAPEQETSTDANFTLFADEKEARAEKENLTIFLKTKEAATLYVGSPVLYRGITVGSVKQKELDEHKEPVLTLLIKKEFATTLRQNSTFWRLPGTKLEAGPGVIKVTLSSLQSLLQGGIAYDNFNSEGSPVQEGATFRLFSNEELAHLNSQPLHMTFSEGQGLLAGQTELRYLGLPVGVVQQVTTREGKVEVIAYLAPGYDFLRQPNTTYIIIRSKLGLDGVSGLETLVSGVYIDCNPARKDSVSWGKWSPWRIRK